METHRILMLCAQQDGAPAVAGVYRTTLAESDRGFLHPAPKFIEAQVEQTLSILHADLAQARAGSLDINIMAAKLFYNMVALHPFKDGNGRLARALVAHALKAAGDPFLLCCMSSKPRRCLQAVRQADIFGDLTWLAAFIFECRHSTWQQFTRALNAQ